jgi:UDP:flavonoid glycosyltransferase YjiC (YdhE family)
MSNFLYAWELGNNLGHVGGFLPVARRLAAAGHRVHLALRETRAADRYRNEAGLRWLQAPFLEERPQSQPPLSYADILLRFGFADSAQLAGHLRAWLDLFELSGAEVIAADHSPAALLAARVAGLPVMLFGTGFYFPPPTRPLPGLRPWAPLPPAELARIEAQALAGINGALATLGAAPLSALSDLFAVAENGLLGFPELDHYPQRGPAAYWGNLLTTDLGDEARWPETPGKKIFAYLRAGSTHAEAVLQALLATGQPTLLVCPDLPPAAAATLAALPQLRVHTQPVRLDRAIAAADIGVTYGGFSTTTALLQAGKPVLVVPGHLEQFLLAWRIEQQGLGGLIHPERPPTDLAAKLAALIEQPQAGERARAFAERYRAFTPEHVLGNLVRRLVQLAGERR